MKILALYNIKGGVGKTAAAVNLAYLAARDGGRTLLWDLDPQGAAGYYLNVDPEAGGGKRLLKGKLAAADLIRPTPYPHLDLLPADFSYRRLDLLLDDTKNPQRGLARQLKPLRERYTRVFLDCPPGISLASESIFHAADTLLVPLIPTTLSLRTLLQLRAFLAEQALTLRLLPFLSLLDRRKKLHREISEQLPADCPDLLETAIPYASEVERMGVARMPLAECAPRSPASAAFAALWAEIKQHGA